MKSLKATFFEITHAVKSSANTDMYLRYDLD